MAYGVKYRLKADTVKYKSEIIIDIEQLDYAGDISNKYIGAGGIALTKDGDGKINGTSLTFSIQSDSNFEYLSFFESDPHEFKVKLYKDSVCVWTGWLIPDEYQEEFISPPYDVHILANDGLGLLKNYDYTTETTVTNHIVRLDAIKKILDNIGLGLSVETAYDVIGTYLGVDLDLFGYIYFRDDYYYNMSCYDVLEKILPPDCTITQHKNKWLIRRNEQDSEKTHYTWTADPPTWTNASGAGESVLNLAVIGAGDVYPIGAAEMYMMHSWKSAIIRSELGQRESFCVNYNFRDALNGWTQSTTGFATAQNDENGTYVKMTGEHEETSEDVPAEYISQSFYYVAEEGHGFMLKLKYSITGYLALIGTGAYKKTQFVVKGRVKIVSGDDTYYLDETHGWTTNNKNFEIADYGNIAGINWKEYNIYTDEPPVANGTITVYLYAGGEWPNTTLVDVNFTDIIVKPYIASAYSNGQVYEIAMKTNGTDTGEVNILPTDAPDIANFDLLFYNGQTYSDNRISDYVANGTLTNTYVNILINSLYWLHGVTRQIISGYFRGPNLHLNSIIQSAVTSSRKYVVKSGTWDVLGDKYQLELLEIPGTASGSSWAVANTDYSAYGDWWPEDGGISSGGGGGLSGGGGGGSDSGYVTISWLDQYFEVVNEGTTGEFIRCLTDFASTGEVIAFNFGNETGNGVHVRIATTTGHGMVMIGSGLETGETGALDLSIATTGTIGGVIIGSGLEIDENGVLTCSATGGVTGGVTDHGALTGLLDDDHPQYLLTDSVTSGLREVMDLSSNGYGHLEKTAFGWILEEKYDHGDLSGLLDNDHPQYSVTGHTHTQYITGFTETDPIFAAASGGFSTTGHTHTNYITGFTETDPIFAAASGGFSTTGHTHTGVYSPTGHTHSEYLATTGIAANSQLLDGYDSLYFSTTGHTHTAYITGITKADVEAVLTGVITSHSHSGGDGTLSVTLITGTTYTLVAGDAGDYLRFNNASGCTVSIPLNATVDFAVGTVVTMEQAGAGGVTVQGSTTGVTINAYDGKTTYGQYAGMQIIQVADDVWTCIAGQG